MIAEGKLIINKCQNNNTKPFFKKQSKSFHLCFQKKLIEYVFTKVRLHNNKITTYKGVFSTKM